MIIYTKSSTGSFNPRQTYRIIKQKEKSNLAEELFLDTSFLTKGAKEDLPQFYDEAIKGPEANQWKEAMDAEMSQLNEMGTCKKEDLPEEHKSNWLQMGICKEKGQTWKNCQVQSPFSCTRIFTKT